ncbi:MAG: DMT family transporter [Pseudomonadota bacterium]
MVQDRPIIGILLMLGFCVAAPLADAFAKLIGTAAPLAMVVAVRYVIQAALLLPLTRALSLSLAVPHGLWPLVVLRTALHVAGITVMFLALRYLPLADAIAIAYVMPFLVLLLGWVFLGETVGYRRLLACIVGFAGTLLVLQPSFRDVGAAALLPLAVAVIFALFMLSTRRIARAIGPLEMQAVNGVLGSLMLLPVLVAGALLGLPELSPAWPDAGVWPLLLLIGVLGTAAHLMLTWALRLAPAATLAPMQYLEIPVAVILGLAIFGEFPGGHALAGIAVVMAAGLYIIVREQAQARAAQPATT